MKDHSLPVVSSSSLPDLSSLLRDFAKNKNKMNDIRAKMAELEEQILRHVEPKDSGSVSVAAGKFKATITFKQVYSFNAEELKAALPEDVFTAITRVKYELDVRPFRKFSEQPLYSGDLTELVKASPQRPYIVVSEA